MADPIVPCPSCQARNRIRTPPPGQTPRCGRCKQALPWLVDANDGSFAAELAAPVPVLVDFWAPWCGPCRTVAPVLQELARENAGALKVVKVDIDQNPQLRARYRIQSIPALMLFQGGEAVDTIVGALPKPALRARLAPYL